MTRTPPATTRNNSHHINHYPHDNRQVNHPGNSAPQLQHWGDNEVSRNVKRVQRPPVSPATNGHGVILRSIRPIQSETNNAETVKRVPTPPTYPHPTLQKTGEDKKIKTSSSQGISKWLGRKWNNLANGYKIFRDGARPVGEDDNPLSPGAVRFLNSQDDMFGM